MSEVVADSYARRRLLELLGIERYVPRHCAAAPVGGASAPTLSVSTKRGAVGAEAPPTARLVAISCEPGVARQYPKFIAHLARAIGVDIAAFARRIDAPHTLCFGASPPAGAVTLAPTLAMLRASPAAKRAFWRTLRDLRRILASR